MKSVRLFRCYDCKRGLDSDLTSGSICPHCGSRRWTQVNEWTLWERLRYWRQQGTFILAPTGLIARVINYLNREKAHG